MHIRVHASLCVVRSPFLQKPLPRLPSLSEDSEQPQSLLKVVQEALLDVKLTRRDEDLVRSVEEALEGQALVREPFRAQMIQPLVEERRSSYLSALYEYVQLMTHTIHDLG